MKTIKVLTDYIKVGQQIKIAGIDNGLEVEGKVLAVTDFMIRVESKDDNTKTNLSGIKVYTLTAEVVFFKDKHNKSFLLNIIKKP